VSKAHLAVPSLFILVLMISVGPFGDTLYTPSLPDIAKDLAVAYSDVQLTMTSYLFGYAVSQLVYGPLSDRFGRRPIMLIGASVFVVGSLICMLSMDIDMLIFGRLVQGLGACAGAVISSAAVRDAFPSSEQGKVFAKINIAFAIAPGVGPVVGTFVAHYFTWHVNFLLLLILSVIVLFSVYWLFPETIKIKNRHAIHPIKLVQTYFSLFKRSGYMVYLLLLGISVGMVYGSLVEAPGLLINVMKLDEKWFLVIAVGIVFAFMLGSWLCTMLCSIANENWILVFGMLITLTGSMLLWILMALDYVNIWGLLIPMIIIFIGIAFEIPIATAKALSSFDKNAGSAAAMMGFFQMGMAALITAIVTFIELGRVFTMPVCFTVLSVIGLTVILGYIFYLRKTA
jgi:DHA1 family bicyclomycin/chloramphenicol resistance-like MFS transporter